MKKYIYLSLFSMLSIPLVMSCKRGGSGDQNRYTETYDPVSVSQVHAALSVENKIKIADTYNRIKTNKFILKGTYHGCFGKEENEEWNLEDSSDERLLIKKADENCKLKIKGFSVKENNSVIAEYSASSEAAKLTQKYSDNPIIFNLKQGYTGFTSTIYSVANITPENFSTNPTISIVISELFTEISNYEKAFNDVEIFVPSFDHSKNILINLGSIYSVNNNAFEVHHDKSNNYTLYRGSYVFENKANPAQEYLVVDSSVSLRTYEEVDAYFKSIKLNSDQNINKKIKTISNSSLNVTISADEIRRNGKIPQLFPASRSVSFKVIFAKSLDVAPNFYSYSIYTNFIRKVGN